MASTHDRDTSLERLLRQSLRARPESPAPGSCLDAETLAAWADGTIATDERAAAEVHMSDCPRCLAILATMAKTSPSPMASKPWWARGLALRWLVPLTAAATAVAFWLVVPRHDVTLPPPVQEADQASRSAASQPPQPGAVAEQPPASVTDQTLTKRADEQVSERRTQTSPATPTEARAARQESVTLSREARAPASAIDGAAPAQTPAASPRASPSAGAAGSAVGGLNETVQAGARTLDARINTDSIEVISPDPSRRWRIGLRGFVQHSTDSGATWETSSSGVVADLTAGSSPSPQVCWVAGRAGTVLLTSDGRRWQRLMFPEAVDLTGIQATDARNASVKTVDGRTLETRDGGLTWRLQGF